jgi:agmatine deiminase
LALSPEWHNQDWIWIGFPHDAEEWPGFLGAAQEQMAAFANAVADSGQQVRLLVRDEVNEARARELCNDRVVIERRVYGDVWVRDTGPLVMRDGAGARTARRFGFNGWGGKYLMEGDQTIGAEIATDAGLEITTGDWILEGGALDADGTGLVATTEQCLLNLNRNPHLTRGDLECVCSAIWDSTACCGWAMASSTITPMGMSTIWRDRRPQCAGSAHGNG